MARRSSINREYVFEICQMIVDQGEAPTVNKIRQHSGAGSFSTISALLDEWRELNQKAKDKDIPAIPDTVEASFRRIWADAWSAVQVIIESERQALHQTRQQMEREQAEMAEEITKLENDLEAVRKDATEIRSELQKAQQSHHTLDVEHARVVERLGASSEQITTLTADLKIANKELAAATTENTRLQTKLEMIESQSESDALALQKPESKKRGAAKAKEAD